MFFDVYVLELLRFETITFRNSYVLWCYVKWQTLCDATFWCSTNKSTFHRVVSSIFCDGASGNVGGRGGVPTH